jgi:hypothetical protein
MARISEAPEGGKFRARAAAALDGQAGAWGDGDLLCVTFDAAGDLVIGAAATTRGVIWTPEGRKDSSKANYKQVIGGKMYTVFTWAVFQEMERGTSPTLDEGDAVFAAAAGDVINIAAGTATGAGAGAIYIGQVLNDETVPGVAGTGLRLILNVNGFTVGLA